jgi:DNA modification methylase
LVVTSPPYFGLRSYQDGGQHYQGQVGAEATPAEFVDALLKVTRECVRVLKPTGSLWVNLGDKYAGGGMGGHSSGLVGSKPQGEGNTYRRTRVDVPTKSLIGIPWRYALRCIDDLGLILRAEVIWAKPNGLPESVTDRVRRSHEQWFHFTLQPRYFSAVDEIREAHVRSWGGAPNGGNTYAAMKAPGEKDANLVTALPNPLGKLPGSVWTVATEPLRVPEHLGVDHFAAFPSEFPKRIITGWSPSGVCVECGEGRRPVVAKERRNGPALVVGAAFQPDTRTETGDGRRHQFQTDVTITGYTCACPPQCRRSSHGPEGWACDCPLPATRPAVVLDPFGGTGTTAHVAHALGRHGISVDLSGDYCRLASAPELIDQRVRKVLGVEKVRPEIDGQAELFGGELTPEPKKSGGLAYAAARGPRECAGCGYRVQYASRSTCEKCGEAVGGAA